MLLPVLEERVSLDDETPVAEKKPLSLLLALAESSRRLSPSPGVRTALSPKTSCQEGSLDGALAGVALTRAGIAGTWGEISSMSMIESSAIMLGSSFPKGESKGVAETLGLVLSETLTRRLRLPVLGLAEQLGIGLELGSLAGETMPLMNIFVCGVY